MQLPAVPVTNPDLQASINAAATALTQLVGLATHAVVGLTTAHSLEAFKNTTFGGRIWGALGSKRIKNLVASVIALFGSLGVTVAMVHSDATAGVYTFTVAGLTTASLTTHLSSFLQQLVLQRTAYVAYVRPTPVKSVEPVAVVPVVPVIPHA